MPTSRSTSHRATDRADAAGPHEHPDHVSRAYHALRRLIVWGQLPPGARLAERAIGERLGLSRTPVRSAIHRLEQEGFVASYGRGRERRLIVAPLTMRDAQEIFHIVAHLEGLAARTAALLPAGRRRVIARNLREINDEIAHQSHHHTNATHWFDLDTAFHRHYVEGVAGPRLLALHRAIKPQSERYSRLYVSVSRDLVAASVREHKRIANAIARGDAAAAQLAAETNWHNAAERLARVIEQHGERGSWQTWAAPEPEPVRRSPGRRSR